MGNQRMDLRIPDSTLSAIKKRAVAEGTSASEIARRVLEAAFDNPAGTGEGAGSRELAVLGGGSPMDLEMLKKAIGEERDEYEKTRSELAEMGLLPDPPNGSGIPAEIVRYMVEILARLNYLSDKVLNHVSIPGVTEGELKDWLKILPPEEEEILKNLKIGGDK